MSKTARLSSRNWAGKAVVAVVFGFLLTVGLAGLILRHLLGDTALFSTQGQLLMWFISPVWACILSFSFLFRSGLSASLWLGVANIVVWGLVYSSQLLLLLRV